MWGNSTILHMADERAAEAAAYGKNPYVIFDHAEIDRYGYGSPFPFPNIGSYEPPGWELLRDEDDNTRFLFVDKTGMDDRGPALSIEGLKRELHRLEDEAEEVAKAEEKECVYGYAIIEEGPFQLCIGIFRKTGEPTAEGPDEDAISKLQYDRQLELLEELSHLVDSKYTAAPTEEGEDEWTVKVFRWFWENDQMAIELDTHNRSMPCMTNGKALKALVALDLLEEDSDRILRDIDLDGYRLQMWDPEEKFNGVGPQNVILYRLTDPEGNVIFFDDDFASNCVDDDDTVRSLIMWLTLQKGDTDDDYFKNYTQDQLDWRDAHAEELGFWGVEPDEESEQSFTMYEVDGAETRFRPWGWEAPDGQ